MINEYHLQSHKVWIFMTYQSVKFEAASSRPSPPMQSSSSLQDIPDSHPPTIILAHTCSLSCITGMITDCQHLKAVRKQSSPADVRKLGEYFLQSFGYGSEAKLAISNAYHLSQSADEFCDFLCPRGMPQAEAQWLFNYIVFSNTSWSFSGYTSMDVLIITVLLSQILFFQVTCKWLLFF